MRKIITAAFVSMDGVIQAPGAPDEDRTNGFRHGGWVAAYWDDGLEAAISELFAPPFDLLLGRTTYDIFAAHWPHVRTDPDARDVGELDRRIAERFNAATKYVATHRPDSLSWQNTRALGSDVVSALRALQREDGPPLITQGSSVLVQTLLAHDLVDEIRLYVFPITLGPGKRLFGDGTQPRAFELTRSAVSPKGALLATYNPVGEVATGSFASPTAA